MGKNVALVEKERVGGTCLNVGCIPSKTFLRSSELFREVKDGERYGVRTGPVHFDIAKVVERKNRVVGTLTKGVESMLKRNGVAIINGHARLLSRNTVQVGAERYDTNNVLIATGSRPVVPPIPGIRSEKVLDSTAVFSLTAIPARVAIIGGGYIGLEFASFFNEIGCDVTVYEMLANIAAGADLDISGRLQQILKRNGVRFDLSCRVLEIDGGTIHYADSTGARSTDAADWLERNRQGAGAGRSGSPKPRASTSVPKASERRNRERRTFPGSGPAEM
jgi:dihydrolipoamide dehydrogenase